MPITIKNRYFSKKDKLLILEFADWCNIKLLGSRLSKNVNVVIKIVDKSIYTKHGLYGLTDVDSDDDWARPRNFTITITNKFKLLRSLIIVAHEMVHVKQHARQELSYCGKTGSAKWYGKKVSTDMLDYWDLPWEIEAHGREKGLVHQWATVHNKIKDSWFKETI